jgi:hypothetical protein
MKSNNTAFWIIGIVIVLLVLANYQSKQEMVGLTPHYYKDGVEVFPTKGLFSVVTPPGGSYDQIAFDVVITNIGNIPIENVQIVNATPIEFKNALPTTIIYLGVGESFLWTSDLMNTSKFEEISPVNFWVNISGTDGVSLIYEGGYSGDISFEAEVVAQRYEFYNAPSLWSGSVYDCKYRAQVFTTGTNGPNEQFTISSVKLFYGKGPTGNPSQVIVSLNSIDVNGDPTGPDLSTGTIEGSEWKTGEWTEIFMSPYVLQPSTQYAIVVKSPNSDNTNYIGFDGYGPYSGYNAIWSGDCGASWSSMALGNYIFEVWGKPAEETEGFLDIIQIVVNDTEVFPTPNPIFMNEWAQTQFNIKVKNTASTDDFRIEIWDTIDNLLLKSDEFPCPALVEDWVYPDPGLVLTVEDLDIAIAIKTFHLEESGWIGDSIESFTINVGSQ